MTPTPKRPGRHKRPALAKKDDMLRISVSRVQRETITAYCESKDLQFAPWARRILLREIENNT